MEIKVFKVGKEKTEEVEIRCHEKTEEIREIVAFVKTRQGQLTGMQEENDSKRYRGTHREDRGSKQSILCFKELS